MASLGGLVADYASDEEGGLVAGYASSDEEEGEKKKKEKKEKKKKKKKKDKKEKKKDKEDAEAEERLPSPLCERKRCSPPVHVPSFSSLLHSFSPTLPPPQRPERAPERGGPPGEIQGRQVPQARGPGRLE